MKILEKVIKKSWDFVLLRTDKYYILNVMFCGSLLDIERSFKLPLNESDLSPEKLKLLSDQIRKNPDSFKHLEIVPRITMS